MAKTMSTLAIGAIVAMSLGLPGVGYAEQDVTVYAAGDATLDGNELAAAINGGVGPSGTPYLGGGVVRLSGVFNLGDQDTGDLSFVQIDRSVELIGEAGNKIVGGGRSSSDGFYGAIVLPPEAYLNDYDITIDGLNFEAFHYAAIWVAGNSANTVIRNCTFKNARVRALYNGVLPMACAVAFVDANNVSYASDMVIENNYFDLYEANPQKTVYLSAHLFWFAVQPEFRGSGGNRTVYVQVRDNEFVGHGPDAGVNYASSFGVDMQVTGNVFRCGTPWDGVDGTTFLFWQPPIIYGAAYRVGVDHWYESWQDATLTVEQNEFSNWWAITTARIANASFRNNNVNLERSCAPAWAPSVGHGFALGATGYAYVQGNTFEGSAPNDLLWAYGQGEVEYLRSFGNVFQGNEVELVETPNIIWFGPESYNNEYRGETGDGLYTDLGVDNWISGVEPRSGQGTHPQSDLNVVAPPPPDIDEEMYLEAVHAFTEQYLEDYPRRAKPAPEVTRLLDVSPLPFRASAIVSYELGEPGRVTVQVYDVAGRAIRVLTDAVQNPGSYAVSWDGRTDAGAPVADGVYFVTLRTGVSTEVMRTVRLK